MQPSRSITVKALTACAAATGDGPLTCATFIGSPMLFNQSGDDSAILTVTAGEKLIINRRTQAIQIGDIVDVVSDIGSFWRTISGAASKATSTIAFVFDELYENDGGSADCSDRNNDASTLPAKIYRYPCDVNQLDGIDDEGYLDTLIDDMGWLTGLDSRDVAGKIGFAARMSSTAEDGGYGSCVWVIVSFNAYKTEMVLKDLVDTGTDLRRDYVLLRVIDTCDLPPDPIETTLCPDALEY